ncbi:response regulator transcription factor [Georgenia yuyongxinii]|uniref:Response regulator transcription factor n=1 Tax=Georgenia yuyongxinii TaxID=2589797 RepID=A0A552WPB9_9MICO|nr:response regulator transcription factor [Georgenia yuyongxinii]TRW44514.1 response regulator transcription factor [Georgenia yuyongxinii]
MSAQVRVVIADDHPMFRYGLRAALAGAAQVEVVGEAGDGAGLLAIVEQTGPDVVLTDLDMPGVDGYTAIRELLTRLPDLPVLVLTMHADDDAVLGGLRAGARGYLLKGAEREEIVRAILTVADGGTVYGARVGRRVSELLTQRPDPAAARPFPGLTAREEEILGAVAEGLGNHAIAGRLGLSEKTVRNNVATILVKLQVPDRAALVARSRDAGLGRREGHR